MLHLKVRHWKTWVKAVASPPHPLANVFNRSFKPLLKEAALPYIVRFHGLKHTCATLLCSKNINPKVA